MNQHPTLRMRRGVSTLSASLVTLFLLLLALTANPAPSSIARAQTPNADLELSVAFPASELAFGESFTYTYTIRNIGVVTAAQVQFKARVPKGVTVESVETSRGDCANEKPRALRCTFGRLKSNESIAVAIRARVETDQATLKFQANVSSKSNDTNPNNNKQIIKRAVQTTQPTAEPHAPEDTTAIIYVVTSNADTGGNCDATPTNCTLRQAITSANGNAGADTIDFTVVGSTLFTPGSPYPNITEQLEIDGTTQTGYVNGSPPPLVINGSSAGVGANGFTLAVGSDSSFIHGLVIQGFDAAGILVQSDSNTIQANCLGTNSGCNDSGGNDIGIQISNGANNVIGGTRTTLDKCDGDCNTIGTNRSGIEVTGASASGNIITGNFIGLRIDGVGSIGNGADGILIDAAPGTIIGGPNSGEDNVVVASTGNGIHIQNSGTDGTKVVGNRIGNDPTESLDVRNVGVGISLENAGTVGNIIEIGGPNAGEANVITGNGRGGIGIDTSIGVLVRGNRIGTNKAGDALINDGVIDIVNGSDGVAITDDSTDNTIGGPNANDGNLISGNNGSGIRVANSGTTGTIIQGNFIGTAVDGVTALANTLHGIFLSGSDPTTIGGNTVGARNTISGNTGHGIGVFQSDGNTIQGNYVGVGGDGTTALGNGGNGVLLSESSSNQVGGAATNEGNIIANSTGTFPSASGTGNGVQVYSATFSAHFNPILGNSIYNNAAEGIALTNSGNELQGFQTITLAASGSTTIEGTFTGTLSESYRLEFFYSTTCDGSGFGEGATYIGAQTVLGTGAAAPFSFFTSGVTVPVGSQVTGTATNSSNNNTSEFSACIAAVAATATPTLTPTNTNTPTSTSTNTPTNTPTNTSTNTATNTPTNTLTNTPTNTSTNTPTNTSTNTPTNTPTNTSTNTPTNTPTNTLTNTPTFTLTSTPTKTPTDTATFTPTFTNTPTNTRTPTKTRTPTTTATRTPTKTKTPTPGTPTVTNTPGDGPDTPTDTPTIPFIPIGGTVTNTPTIPFIPSSGTSTSTPTPSNTPSTTTTPTTPTSTTTATATITETPSFTFTPTSSITPAVIGTVTFTPNAAATNNAATQTAAAQTGTLVAQAATNTPGALASPTPLGGIGGGPTPTPTPTGTGGGALGVGGGFPLIALGGLADFNLPWFVEHVRTPQEAFSGGLAKILPNLLLALLLALLFGFFGTLQSNVLEEHEEEIKGWIAPITRPLSALAAAGAALDANLNARGLQWAWEGIKLLLVLFIYGLIFSFLDPSFTFSNPSWLLLVVAVMLSVGLVSLIDDIAVVLYSRRYGGQGTVGVNGANAGVAMASMIFSRFVGLAPGIVFGSAGSAQGELKGHPTTHATLGIVSIGVTALLGWAVSAFVPQTQGANLWLSTLFLLIFAVGIQTLFFELIPVYGNMGRDFFAHSKGLWAILFTAVLFLFIQTQLNPEGDFVQAFNQRNMITLIIVVAVFCVISAGLWLYFWNRDRRK